MSKREKMRKRTKGRKPMRKEIVKEKRRWRGKRKMTKRSQSNLMTQM